MTIALIVAVSAAFVCFLIARGFATQFHVLRVLAAHGGWMRGRNIVEAGGGKISKSSVYICLDALEKSGVVESRFDGMSHGIRMRAYRVKPKYGVA